MKTTCSSTSKKGWCERKSTGADTGPEIVEAVTGRFASTKICLPVVVFLGEGNNHGVGIRFAMALSFSRGNTCQLEMGLQNWSFSVLEDGVT